MELIKIAWVVVFFVFSLTLLFVWSKMYIVAKKVKVIDALLTVTENVDKNLSSDGGDTRPS
jgi:hypothetical protein